MNGTEAKVLALYVKQGGDKRHLVQVDKDRMFVEYKANEYDLYMYHPKMSVVSLVPLKEP